MQQRMIDTYESLMTALDALPDEIGQVQEHITNLRLSASDYERTLTQREAILVQQAEGKNAELRKAALVQMQATDGIYRSTTQRLDNVQHELAEAQDSLSALERRYGAVCYQAKLHAALLGYLAGAGAPVKAAEVQFMASPAGKRNGVNGASQVSAADAAELGL
jgi:chromosome segregation ATPase